MSRTSGLPSEGGRAWWVKAIIILVSLPVLAWPTLLSRCSTDSVARTFVWLYPAYVIAAAVCAWICRRRRPEITWIIVFLMILTHAAMWVLVDMPL